MKCSNLRHRIVKCLYEASLLFFFLQEPIFVPDPVISLAVEPKNKVKTESKYQIVPK